MHRHLLSALHSISIAVTLAILITTCCSPICAQEIFYSEDSDAHRWIASASVGLTSPFGPDAFSVSWSGRHSFMATIEYYPDSRASFGGYASHAAFDHTGHTEAGPAE